MFDYHTFDLENLMDHIRIDDRTFADSLVNTWKDFMVVSFIMIYPDWQEM